MTNQEKLLKNKSVQNWMQSLETQSAAKGKTLSKKVRNTRLKFLQDYIQYTGLDSEQLIQEAENNIGNTMIKLTGFLNWLQGTNNNNVKPRSRTLAWNSACTVQAFVRGFYTHNDLTFPKRFKTPQRRVSKCSQRDAKTPIFDYDEEKDEIVYNNGILQHFISNLNFRDQTIALCLLSTGADTTDLLRLTVAFIKDGKGNITTKKRLLWHDNRNKDGVEFKVYFSSEATSFLKRYVEQERNGAQDTEPLFIKEDGTPLNAHALAINFRHAAEKMGLNVEHGKSHPFRPKRLRHLFRTAAGNAHVDSGYVQAFMGHRSDISNSYLEKSDSMFLREYVKLEPYVIVYGTEKNSMVELSAEMTELKGENQQLKQGMMRLQLNYKELKKDFEDKYARLVTLSQAWIQYADRKKLPLTVTSMIEEEEKTQK